jgi:drug/metabolite transporter (DMT)-like permease
VTRGLLDVRTRYIIVVLVSALVVAFETVAIEGTLNIAGVNILLVSSFPSIVGGLVLLSLRPKDSAAFARTIGPRGWLSMVLLCAIIAVGVLLWFDSVGRIGAGKEALLGGGSSEVLFVVLLSAAFLHERLRRLEAAGGIMIVIGVFLVLADAEALSLDIGFGEAEAILSSLALGASVVLTTALLRRYERLMPFSGFELLLSGVMLFVACVASGLVKWPDATGWMILVLIGLFPAAGLLTYNAGLPKIGASLTSVLFALTGVMTVGVQLLVLFLYPDAEIMLPKSVPIAVFGGAVAFAGVYILKSSSRRCEVEPGKGK